MTKARLYSIIAFVVIFIFILATVAQQVEQLTRNEQVVRSNRIGSSINLVNYIYKVFLYIQSKKNYKALVFLTDYCSIVKTSAAMTAEVLTKIYLKKSADKFIAD